MLHITEVLRHGQTGKCNSHSRSGRLVHLSVNQGSLIQNAAFLHFSVKVVTLTSTLSYTGKYGDTAVGCCHVMDQLHDQYGFTYSRTTEKSDFSSLCVRTNQVYYLDTCLQDLCSRGLLLERRSRTVNRPSFFSLRSRFFIHRISQNVEDSSQAGLSNRYCNGVSCINSFHSSNQAIGGTHCDTTYHIISQLLCNLRNQLGISKLDGNCVQ